MGSKGSMEGLALALMKETTISAAVSQASKADVDVVSTAVNQDVAISKECFLL